MKIKKQKINKSSNSSHILWFYRSFLSPTFYVLRTKEGFTLIESIIYSLMISGMIIAAVLFALNVSEGQQKARSYQEVQQNARFALERIVQEIKSANDLNTTSSVFGAHPGYLSLSHEDSSKNPTIFSVASEKLVMKQGANATSTLTSDNVRVTNLIFTNLSMANRTKNIRISMRVEHVNPDNVTVFTASTTIETSATIRDQEDQP
ncbi:MAG: type II secretion system protein [Patescibacteria group bacterium]